MIPVIMVSPWSVSADHDLQIMIGQIWDGRVMIMGILGGWGGKVLGCVAGWTRS
jgi:hypothetical protein